MNNPKENIEIIKLRFHTRLENALIVAGYTTIDEILSAPHGEIVAVQNLGANSMCQLFNMMIKLGQRDWVEKMIGFIFENPIIRNDNGEVIFTIHTNWRRRMQKYNREVLRAS